MNWSPALLLALMLTLVVRWAASSLVWSSLFWKVSIIFSRISFKVSSVNISSTFSLSHFRRKPTCLQSECSLMSMNWFSIFGSPEEFRNPPPLPFTSSRSMREKSGSSTASLRRITSSRNLISIWLIFRLLWWSTSQNAWASKKRTLTPTSQYSMTFVQHTWGGSLSVSYTHLTLPPKA